MHKESGHRWKSRGLALPSPLLQLTLHDIRSRERRRPVSLFPSYLGDFLTAPALHCCPWLPANGRAGHTAADGPRCPSAISPWSQTAVKLRHARLICPSFRRLGETRRQKDFPPAGVGAPDARLAPCPTGTQTTHVVGIRGQRDHKLC